MNEPINLSSFPKFGRDNLRFYYRMLHGGFQVYAEDLTDIAQCLTEEMAEAVTEALNSSAEEDAEINQFMSYLDVDQQK